MSHSPTAHLPNRRPLVQCGRDAPSPRRGAGRGLAHRTHSGTGERRARSAHKETAGPARAGSARPLRDSRPPPQPGRSPQTHTQRHTPQPHAPGPRPAAPHPARPPGRAALTSCRQQKATSVQRPLHLPMALGAARAVRRGAPLARRPPPPPRRAGSASSQLGAPGGGAGRLGPGPGAPGPQGCGRLLALGVHGQSARAPALPRLLCLAGRPPGASPAPGRLAGSAERGAQAPRAAQRRAALPSRGSRPGARRPRLPGPTTWLRRREVGKEGKKGGKRRGGEGWGGAAEQAEGGEKGEGSAEQRREAGVKWQECRLGD